MVMQPSGTNQEQARPHNRRAVLEAIRQHGPISRAEIARRVGLSIQTVSTITSDLHERGFLTLRPSVPKGRGFPAPLLDLHPEGGFALGIYVSPRGLEVGLMNLAGDLVERRTVAIPHMQAAEAFRRIGHLAGELVEPLDADRILGVGMALPGPFGVEPMSFVGSTTMEGWRGVDVHEKLRATLPFPAFVASDSAAAAHGEQLYGLGTEFRDFFYLYMGVGLGGCMIADGRVLRGARGNASEIGHVPLVPGGEPCPCGNRGCVERYLSLDAFERRAPGLDAEGWASQVAPIFRAAIVTIENLFEPETIVLGGLAPAGLQRRLLDLAQDLPVSLGAREGRRTPRVVPSRAGADAPLRGAASLAVGGVFTPGSGQPVPDILGRRRKVRST